MDLEEGDLAVEDSAEADLEDLAEVDSVVEVTEVVKGEALDADADLDLDLENKKTKIYEKQKPRNQNM